MKALLLVDIQNDFLPGGALGVREGDRVIPVANELMARFELIVSTQDWHPPDHQSFAVLHPGRRPGDLIELHGLPQTLWPVHCVQHSHGAAFADSLRVDRIHKIFRKGTDPEVDSYSGFFDNGRRKDTLLSAFLKKRGVDHVFIAGLATDYCVKFTALDARREGFQTSVVLEGCRGVELQAGDSDKAVAEMQAAGVAMVDRAGVAVGTGRERLRAN